MSFFVGLIILILGLIMGSFLNVVIYRLPRGESLLLPPSHCPNCRHRLRIWDLIPLFSFLCLKGRCYYCKTPISWRYPLVEFLTGVLTLLVWYKFGYTPEGIAAAILTFILITITFIDLEHQIIPNWITLPAIFLGLAYRLYQGEIGLGLLGGLVGGGILLIVALVYPRGMGMGDVKLLAMVGVFLGWEETVLVLFLGSLLGVLIVLPLMLLKILDRKTPFPFGPFLALATLLMVFIPDLIRLFLPLGG